MSDRKAATKVTAAVKRSPGIRERRPVQIQFRITPEENNALWAMHIKTKQSKSSILRELVVAGLTKGGYLDSDTAKRILEQEKVARNTIRVPVI